jgi:hypothetical protein
LIFCSSIPWLKTFIQALGDQVNARRKETIERVFADATEKHGIQWTTLRGLKKIVHAGDAYICGHEFKETSNLDLSGCLMMLLRLI